MKSLAKVLLEASEKMEKDYPTTMLNGRRVPVCTDCGQVTDVGPAGLRDCQNCVGKMLDEIGPFNI